MPLGNQVIDLGKFFLSERFQLINKEHEWHHSATLRNEWIEALIFVAASIILKKR